MKTTALFLLIGLTASIHANADDSYVYENVVPGYSVKMLEAGYSLSHYGHDSVVNVPVNTEFVKLVGTESQNCLDEMNSLKGESNSFADSYYKATTPMSAPTDKTKVSAPQPKPIVDAKIDLPGFTGCATKALPRLKHALGAELAGDEAKAQKFLLPTNSERATETGLSTAGLACGKYLGKASIARPATIADEIKVLLALTARSGDEQSRLLKALVAARHAGASADVLSLWDILWKRLSVLAVLGSKPLPSFDQLLADEKAAQVASTSGMTTSLTDTRVDIDAAYKSGLAYASKMTGGL